MSAPALLTQLGQHLEQGLVAMGLDAEIDALARQRLLHYLVELLRWNRVHNLSAIQDPQVAVERHLLDSLSFLPFLPAHRPVYDIGSGAGLPGIPLAIARPQQAFTLVEPAAKRVAFLRHSIALLGLPAVTVFPQRAEKLPTAPQMVLVSRATAELADFLQMVAACLQPGTLLLLAKGPAWPQELARLPEEWKPRFVAHPIAVPGQPQRFLLQAQVPLAATG
ncbi:16S rRNA (guanine(527)-N(7))-methyltransferase RsmG [Candidatus Igneacidithiobacillus taiwanensis]|uniref:16S rRNA (guanine(527)-N(7))-methyltransferase RsmG n=1 Tax=Candidatus Igneacidithiobacillus taiwanensis TaxID=1945924 RepID=UPI0028A1E8C5|nr:16S rRNA (guanine(527)-N(7))-methyltransferase RsmG [Candidatus Igneacidithiobacillus taiwanensis]